MDQKGHYVLIVDPSLLKTGQNSVRILTKYQNESFEILSRFHYCASDIELLGEGESSLSSQGDLLFHHEVNVLSEGNFLFEGILYQNGKMVAKAHIVKSLSEGLNLVDLKYYGFLFYDRMLSGSFELRNLQVSSIDENLNSKNIQFFNPRIKTKNYFWDQFNSTPYNNEIIQDKIKKLTSL